ncbi:hypothetical protein IU433_18365 [Nocardia puris]|uniref:Uncharacterized protein n=1 Tax=Nocardia puris TaxID=208602 RepID=A0A366D820_9NOCA|nr:hypothetical protein [Nocardia puris]MBF6212409.1 hypothetical protein [Nocardia puris]MBF6366656.1 hypothetical protein [Nocardia puris]MBF6460998.1 hypothetical protein [Nocardia puris]RBO85649.1 hypothetical protein DFR74_114192 [Nocardia puris]
MSYLGIDHRVTGLDRHLTKLEHPVSDFEETVLRDIRRVTIFTTRLAEQNTTLGYGIAQIMRHLGLPPITVGAVAMPTEAEIDESFEADC